VPRNCGAILYVCGHRDVKLLTFGFEISCLEMRLKIKRNFKVLRKEGIYEEKYIVL
jgi:hypothetical protein